MERLVCAIAHPSYDGRPHPRAEAMYPGPDSQEGNGPDEHDVGRQLGDLPASAVEVFPTQADHPISSYTSISRDANRSVLPERFGQSWISRLWTSCKRRDWDSHAENGSRNGSQTSSGPLVVTRRSPFFAGLAGTPGGTRIPNLLIRRWTHPVHRSPQRSIPSGTNRFAVHSRP